MPSYQNVDVFLMDKATHTPLEGVLVRVLSEDGSRTYTEGYTDEYGRAGFLLYTQRYSLRFYRYQMRFSMPQIIDVLEGPNETAYPNAFNVYAEVLIAPVANDPLLCRASGTFRDITGAPHRWLEMIFIGEFAPILLDGSGVLSERRAVKTDKEGYACVDLIRCAKYSATIQGYEDHTRTILVPDAPSVSLPALLFAVVDYIYFDCPSPWTVSVGQDFPLRPTVLTNSKVASHTPDIANVQWKVENPNIASVTVLQKKLVIRGLMPGQTRLLATRSDWSIVEVPFKHHIHGSGQPIVVQ